MRKFAHFCVGVLVVFTALVSCPTVASAAPLLDTNILSNPGFEDATANGWVGTYSQSSTSPYSGTYYYDAPDVGLATISQNIDLIALGYDSQRLATGGYRVDFGGYVKGAADLLGLPLTLSTIGIKEYAGGVATPHNLSSVSSSSWTNKTGSFRLTENTEILLYNFEAQRVLLFGANRGRLDDAYLKLREYDIWTWGGSMKLASIGDLDAGSGNLTIEGMTVTNNATLTSSGWSGIDGTVNINKGTWTASGQATVGYNGTAEINITNGGTWNTQSWAILGHESYNEATVNINKGTWTASGNADVGYKNTGEVNVADGGTWNTTGFNTHLGSATGGQGTVNVNGGTWNASSSGFTIVGGSGLGKVNVTNGGTWNTTGTVHLGSATGCQGTVKVDVGTWTASEDVFAGIDGTSEINIATGGTWITTEDAALGYWSDGQGTVNVNGGTWTASGRTQIGHNGTGEVNVNTGGQFTVDNYALEINDKSTLNINGGTVILNAGVTNNGTIDIVSGILSINGTANSKKTTVQSGGVAQLNGATFNAVSGGYFNVLGDVNGCGEINVGTVGLDVGFFGSLLGTSYIERFVVNGDVRSSGLLSHVTINGDVSVGSSPGSMTVNDVILTSSGTLEMELGGLIAGTQHDQIIVNGPFGLAGKLDVLWYGGFEAVLGDSFTLFDLTGGGPMTGTFDSITLPPTKVVTWRWDTYSLYTDGTITVVPEPATLSLLLLGGVALIRRRP